MYMVYPNMDNISIMKIMNYGKKSYPTKIHLTRFLFCNEALAQDLIKEYGNFIYHNTLNYDILNWKNICMNEYLFKHRSKYLSDIPNAKVLFDKKRKRRILKETYIKKNKWMKFLMKYYKEHKELSFKECMREASKIYVK